MSRSYHFNQTLRDAETYRRHGIKPTDPVAPTEQRPWDGFKNSELRGLITPAKPASELTRRAHAATVADEQRTEGKQLKHRTNHHE
jgi:hypothetical protein